MLINDSDKRLANAAEVIANITEKAKQLPEPVGYKILCALPEIDSKFDNGLYKADATVKAEEHSTTVLFVLKCGPMAYTDTSKFPTGPWCKEGDFVVVRAYTGTRIKIHGREFRILNDDQIEATVDDPRGIAKAA